MYAKLDPVVVGYSIPPAEMERGLSIFGIPAPGPLDSQARAGGDLSTLKVGQATTDYNGLQQYM